MKTSLSKIKRRKKHPRDKSAFVGLRTSQLLKEENEYSEVQIPRTTRMLADRRIEAFITAVITAPLASIGIYFDRSADDPNLKPEWERTARGVCSINAPKVMAIPITAQEYNARDEAVKLCSHTFTEEKLAEIKGHNNTVANIWYGVSGVPGAFSAYYSLMAVFSAVALRRQKKELKAVVECIQERSKILDIVENGPKETLVDFKYPNPPSGIKLLKPPER